MEDEYDTILGRILNEELPKKNVVFFLSFWKILYLSRRTTFADSSSFPSRLYGAQDRETFTPEYDVEVQFNFAIIAKLRMNSNKSYEAVQCQLTCNFVLPYWTSSAKTAFEEKDTNHRVRELLSEHTHTRINYAIKIWPFFEKSLCNYFFNNLLNYLLLFIVYSDSYFGKDPLGSLSGTLSIDQLKSIIYYF